MNLDRQPSLRGISAVVTRSREQNARLQEALEARGAEVILLPTLRFVSSPMTDALRGRLLVQEDYTHLVFTSQTAVEFFEKACREAGVPASAWHDADIAAVGPATANALEEHGWTASLIAHGGGEALAEKLLATGYVNSKSHVLLPQSAIARPELERALTTAGVRVTIVGIYNTATETPESVGSFLARMRKGAPDSILFASPSAVKAFLELTRDVGERFLARPETHVISIGSTTSEAIRELGYKVSAQAEQPGVGGLVAALEAAVE